MGFKKKPNKQTEISDGINTSDLYHSKAMSIKSMNKVAWVLCSIQKLQIAYFAESCRENSATIDLGFLGF